MNRERLQKFLGLKDINYYYFDKEEIAHKLTEEKLIELAEEHGLNLFENVFMKVEHEQNAFREIEHYIFMGKHKENIIAEDDYEEEL